MRSLNAATLYPGLCFLEYAANMSMGRGTDAPFEQIGADFIGGRELAHYLNKREIPGVRVYPTAFTPTESNFKGKRIEGVRFVITNRELLNATRLGLEVAVAIEKLYPGKIDWKLTNRSDRQRRRHPADSGHRRPATDRRVLTRKQWKRSSRSARHSCSTRANLFSWVGRRQALPPCGRPGRPALRQAV